MHRTSGLLGRWQGEPEGEGAALALFALDGDRAAVLLGDLAGAGQADPLAVDLADVVGAVVRLEQPRQVVRRDADTVVADLHRRPPTALVPAGIDGDADL